MVRAIEFRWSGQVMEPVDYMAFIGKNPGTDEHIYIVTGDSGNGMTHGTIAGIILSDLILSRKNSWSRSSTTLREKNFGAAGEFLKENLNVAAQYADWATAAKSNQSIRSSPEKERSSDAARGRLPSYKDYTGRSTSPLRGVHSPVLHRGLEFRRENMGLPMPWIALRSVRKCRQRSRDHSAA